MPARLYRAGFFIFVFFFVLYCCCTWRLFHVKQGVFAMATDKSTSVELNSSQRSWVADCIELKLKALLRARNATVSGSALYQAISADILTLQGIQALFH